MQIDKKVENLEYCKMLRQRVAAQITVLFDEHCNKWASVF
jgi:hypothetical protein